MAKTNRKSRHLVEWDAVQKKWAPKKMTIGHALQIAEEQAVELMAKTDAAMLKDAREHVQKLAQQRQGVKPSTIAKEDKVHSRADVRQPGQIVR